MFVRRNIWTLNPDPNTWHPTVSAYAKAVEVMRSRDGQNPPDPTSWEYQSARHDTGPAGIVPPGGQFEQCQHSSWYFLAWHRMYLYYFERIVRKAVIEAKGPEDFALPYWNYSAGFPTNTLPHPFRQLPNGAPNPLFVPAPDRFQGINNGAALHPLITDITRAMGMPEFAGPISGFGGLAGGARAHFGGSPGEVELTPHNAVHREVGSGGGWMGDPATAALDPIFWLHHANIDRLWNRWVAAGHTSSADTAWRNEMFQFHDEHGVLQTLSVRDVLDTASQLDYVYDDDQGPQVMATPEPQREAPRTPELFGATESSVTLTGEPVRVGIFVPDELRAAAETRNAAPGNVAIALEDVTAATDPDVVYALYLNDWLTTEGGERYYIGNLALFGMRQRQDLNAERRDEGGMRLVYDITSLSSELARRGAWDFREVAVTFEPIGFGAEKRGAERASVEQAPVTIGRIGMYIL